MKACFTIICQPPHSESECDYTPTEKAIIKLYNHLVVCTNMRQLFNWKISPLHFEPRERAGDKEKEIITHRARLSL